MKKSIKIIGMWIFMVVYISTFYLALLIMINNPYKHIGEYGIIIGLLLLLGVIFLMISPLITFIFFIEIKPKLKPTKSRSHNYR